jgi:hypothetical protein
MPDGAAASASRRKIKVNQPTVSVHDDFDIDLNPFIEAFICDKMLKERFVVLTFGIPCDKNC